jgi:hypothetical protein
MKLKFKDLEGDAPKLSFWKGGKDLYVPDFQITSSRHSKKIVFTQAAMHHPVYAYSAYLSILSLYASTNLGDYDIRVYCTHNLVETLKELFDNFPKVKVIQYQFLCDIHPNWVREDNNFRTCVKTQFWWDSELWNYDVICGLDADLFGVGSGGSFEQIENIQEGIFLAPTGRAWEIFKRMMEHLNHNPEGRVVERIKEEFSIDCEESIKAMPWWGNSSLHAFPSKYISNPNYDFIKFLDFWFKEPCYCDESFLTLFSVWHNINLKEINSVLHKTKHYLEHDPIFKDKTIPMNKVHYNYDSAITHRLSTTESAKALAPRFQEFLDYTKHNFLRNYAI